MSEWGSYCQAWASHLNSDNFSFLVADASIKSHLPILLTFVVFTADHITRSPFVGLFCLDLRLISSPIAAPREAERPRSLLPPCDAKIELMEDII